MTRKIDGELYYPVPEAAERVGVSRGTMYHWVTSGVRLNGVSIKVQRDPISKHLYVAASSVEKLANRFQRVRTQEAHNR